MVKTTKLDSGALERTLRRQDRVVTRAQTVACGMTPGALRHRTRPGGPWQRLLPGVYLAVTGSPTQAQKETAAVLYAGRAGVLTGPAALRRHGIAAPGSEAVSVLAPASRAPRSQGFARVLPTTRMPPRVCVDQGLQYAMPARAVADAAREMERFRDVRAVVADAVQQGRCRLDLLGEELACGPVRRSALLRRALAEVGDGVRSAAEGDFRDLLRHAGVPRPVFNARLYAEGKLLAVADAWWPAAGVAVEVESRAWHLSPEAWERTLRRDARMGARGIIVLHVTPRQIREEPAQVVADVRAALRAGCARTAPAVQMAVSVS